MIKQILLGILLSLTLMMLAACGDSSPAHINTSATLKISLSGTPTANIAGVSFTVTLPANVSPATVGGVVESSVVTPSGTFTGSTIAPIVTYTPATASVPGSLQIVVTTSEPAGVATAGEIATITLKLANNAAPTSASFPSLSGLSIIDTSGGTIVGLPATVSSVTLQ